MSSLEDQSSVFPRMQRGLVETQVLRTADASLEAAIAEPVGDAGPLIEGVRRYWALLRDLGLAEANPIKIVVDAAESRSILWLWRWKDAWSRARAASNPDCVELLSEIESLARAIHRIPFANEVYQGFESSAFPSRGGIELLRGKCTCSVKLDQYDVEFELDGQNGFVVMHRGPAFVQGSARLMPITLVAHGADTPNPLRRVPLPPDSPLRRRLDVDFRVEQNTELPQFGIVRALSEDSDFPAVALWAVHWRVHTPMGTLITDPAQPLVFGPTIVEHYPPVGTEFRSAVGPVDVFLSSDGRRVGTLTPGELTAFDIVVTMDDETPSPMDPPARYHVDLFNRFMSDPSLTIDAEGLLDDFRVPNPRPGE